MKKKLGTIVLLGLLLNSFPTTLFAAEEVTYESKDYLNQEGYRAFGMDTQKGAPDQYDPNDLTHPYQGYQKVQVDEVFIGWGTDNTDSNEEKATKRFKILENFDGNLDTGKDLTKRANLLVQGQKTGDNPDHVDTTNLSKDRKRYGMNAIGFEGRPRNIAPANVEAQEKLAEFKYSGENISRFDLTTDEVYLDDQKDQVLRSEFYLKDGKSVLSFALNKIDDNSKDLSQTSKVEYGISGNRGSSDDWVKKIEADLSLSLMAMAKGDYDKDGKEEVAVYIPRVGSRQETLENKKNTGPFIAFLETVNDENGSLRLQEKKWGKMTEGDLENQLTHAGNNEYRIYLNQIDKELGLLWGADYHDEEKWKDFYLPSVHLNTTKVANRDQLVISATLPRVDSDPYKEKKRTNYLQVVDFVKTYASGENIEQTVDSLRAEFVSLNNTTSHDGERMQFAASVDGDLDGDGRDELIVVGYKNTGCDSEKDFGEMNKDNLLMKTYQAENTCGKITTNGQFVEEARKILPEKEGFDELKAYKKVNDNQLDDQLKVDEEILPPVALDAGVTSPAAGSAVYKATLFANGVLHRQEGTVTISNNQRSYPMEKKAQIGNLDTNGGPLIQTGYFARQDAASPFEQLLVVATDHRSSNKDHIYYDALTVREEGDKFLTQKNNNDLSAGDENGTFACVRPLDVDYDSVYFKYLGKETSWSKPSVLAIIPSIPYLKELDYANEGAYLQPSISMNFTSSKGDGTNLSWGVGAGVNVSVGNIRQPDRPGLKKITPDGGEFGGSAGYIASYEKEATTSFSVENENYAGQDQVISFASPQILYKYSRYTPQGVMTAEKYQEIEEYISQYMDSEGNKQTVPESVPVVTGEEEKILQGEVEEITVTENYPPTFSSQSVEEFNEAVKIANKNLKHGSEKIQEINMAAIIGKNREMGNPYTYPRDETDLVEVDPSKGGTNDEDKIGIIDGTLIDGIDPDNSEGFQIQYSDKKEDSTKFEAEYAIAESSGQGAEGNFTIGIIWGDNGKKDAMSAEIEGSAYANLGGQEVNTLTESVKIGYTRHSLPKRKGPNELGAFTEGDYSYSVKPAIWQTSAYKNTQLNNKLDELTEHFDDQIKNTHPYVISGLASTVNNEWDKEKVGLAPKIPSNLRVFHRDPDQLTLAWDPPKENVKEEGYRTPDYYKLFQESSEGVWEEVELLTKDNRIPANQNFATLTLPAVDSGEKITYGIRSYRKTNSAHIYSSIGIPLTVAKIDESNYPKITKQPNDFYYESSKEKVNQDENGTKVFSVEVEPRQDTEQDTKPDKITWEAFTGDTEIGEAGEWLPVENSSSEANQLVLSNEELEQITTKNEVTHFRAKVLRDGYFTSHSNIVNIYSGTINRPSMELMVEAINEQGDYEAVMPRKDSQDQDQYLVPATDFEEDKTLRVTLALEEVPSSGSLVLLQDGKEAGKIDLSENQSVENKFSFPVHNIDQASTFSCVYTGTSETTEPAEVYGKDQTPSITITKTDTVESEELSPVKSELNGGYALEALPEKLSSYDGIKKLPALFKAGQRFIGWRLEHENGEALLNLDGDQPRIRQLLDAGQEIKIVAKWEPIKHTIAYDLAGGTTDQELPTEVESLTSLALPTPKREGYTFAGWYTDKEYQQKAASFYSQVNSDINFYAKWEQERYQVNFVDQSGKQVQAAQQYSYDQIAGGKTLAVNREGNQNYYKDIAMTQPVTELSENYYGNVTLLADEESKPAQEEHQLTVKNGLGGTTDVTIGEQKTTVLEEKEQHFGLKNSDSVRIKPNPTSGYEVSSIKQNNQAIELKNQQLELNNLEADATIEVSFKKLVSEDSTSSGSSDSSETQSTSKSSVKKSGSANQSTPSSNRSKRLPQTNDLVRNLLLVGLLLVIVALALKYYYDRKNNKSD